DAAEEESLLPLHPCLIGDDAVKAFAGELATTTLDEAHVRREPAEIAIAERRRQAFEPEPRIPAGVETSNPGEGGHARARAFLGIGHGAGDLKVLVDRLARHEEVHDLARALEDQIDAAVAQQPLDADRRLPATLQRALGLVSAATADLQRAVDQ